MQLNGRDTIAFDFAGDEHAKTHGRDEDALKKVSGTVWIDEADHEVSRMSATLDENYHVGFGLLASVAKGSNVVFDQALIRNEAWLPTAIALHLQARAFLVAGIPRRNRCSLRPISQIPDRRRAATRSNRALNQDHGGSPLL